MAKEIMPTYEFYCDSCDMHKDVCKPIAQCNDPELCTCGVPMKRLYTAPGISFKGSGWGGQA
jgi:putative FmdB family regulatory protein